MDFDQVSDLEFQRLCAFGALPLPHGAGPFSQWHARYPQRCTRRSPSRPRLQQQLLSAAEKPSIGESSFCWRLAPSRTQKSGASLPAPRPARNPKIRGEATAQSHVSDLCVVRPHCQPFVWGSSSVRFSGGAAARKGLRSRLDDLSSQCWWDCMEDGETDGARFTNVAPVASPA